jgi:hypothetical protein
VREPRIPVPGREWKLLERPASSRHPRRTLKRMRSRLRSAYWHLTPASLVAFAQDPSDGEALRISPAAIRSPVTVTTEGADRRLTYVR